MSCEMGNKAFTPVNGNAVYQLNQNYNLPDAIGGMICIGRMQVIKGLYSLDHCKLDPRDPLNPDNHIQDFIKRLKMAVPHAYVHTASKEEQNARRDSFGVIFTNCATLFAWADYFEKKGYTKERMEGLLGDDKTYYEQIFKPEENGQPALMNFMAELLQRTKRENGVEEPFILRPGEDADRTIAAMYQARVFEQDWYVLPDALIPTKVARAGMPLAAMPLPN